MIVVVVCVHSWFRALTTISSILYIHFSQLVFSALFNAASFSPSFFIFNSILRMYMHYTVHTSYFYYLFSAKLESCLSNYSGQRWPRTTKSSNQKNVIITMDERPDEPKSPFPTVCIFVYIRPGHFEKKKSSRPS